MTTGCDNLHNLNVIPAKRDADWNFGRLRRGSTPHQGDIRLGSQPSCARMKGR